MSRIYKVIFYGLLIFIVYFLVSTVYSTCGDKSAEMLENAKDGVENVSGTVNDAANDLNDEFFSDDDTETSQEEDNSLANDLFDDSDEKKEAIAEAKKTYSQPAPTPTPSPKPTYSNNGGKYMVIAGNFLVDGNADNMVRKLENLGYDAESVVFDGSQYYTVLANRSDDYNNALSISSRLKSEGIDNYVKTQTY